MTFQKNWMTHLMMAVATAIIGLNMIGYCNCFIVEMVGLERFVKSGSGLSYVIGVAIGVVILVAPMLFCYRTKYLFTKSKKSALWVCLLFLVALVYRICLIQFTGCYVMGQLVLQMLAICFLYLGMKRLVGNAVAMLACLFFAFLPSYTNLLFCADAQCLVFFLFTLCIYGLTFLFAPNQKGFDGKLFVLKVLFAALCAGISSYLEPYCLIALLFGVCLCFQDGKWYQGKMKACLCVIYCVETFVVLFFCFFLEALWNQGDWTHLAVKWCNNLITYHGIYDLKHWAEALGSKPIEGIILVLFAFFTLPPYQKGVKPVKQIPFWVFLLVAPIPFCRVGYLQTEVFSLWVWVMLASLGIGYLEKSRLQEEKTVTPRMVFEELEPQNIEENEEAKQEETQSQEIKLEETQSQETESIQYIPNPLPVPKKHVRKVADFQLDVAEDDDFDFAITDNDDFDFA